MKIEKRTFIVSGGSSGLGLATVRSLLVGGAYVSVLDLSAPPEDARVSPRVRFFSTDITDADAIEAAVEGSAAWTQESGAPLAGVINCAGVGIAAKLISVDKTGARPPEPHSLDVWKFALNVNLTGTFNLTRLALKHLVRVAPEEGEDGERGVIVMVASAAAFEGQPGQTAYSATKGALAAMTLPMARDLSRYGVRVATIAPGVFASSMTDAMNAKTQRSLRTEGIVYPQRFGKPDEFAQTVRWILECPYVNGETIRLSGAGRLPARL
ncbi:3-hydroxy-acyl-CoA-dehydrogenase [Schizophyllum amplum]|uniref:3-hydroxy-acyl-CoA-dehydrogenase n=1 Tax=Schizophyllum amplum TaxID=97359 RepID=A0A550CKW5_9AGAR|nr:3-hydroxy-acyl-CoA-dehydrogenase [Auriculariopsis ampla]